MTENCGEIARSSQMHHRVTRELKDNWPWPFWMINFDFGSIRISSGNFAIFCEQTTRRFERYSSERLTGCWGERQPQAKAAIFSDSQKHIIYPPQNDWSRLEEVNLCDPISWLLSKRFGKIKHFLTCGCEIC